MRGPGVARSWPLAVLLLVAAGCGGTVPAPASSAVPSDPSPLASMAPPPASATTPATTPPTTLPGLAVDADLLAILPPVVGGAAMEADPATAGSLAANPDLATTASAVAIGRYVTPGGSSGDDLAVVSVVRLRPGVFSERFFDTWRSDYDASACEPAGGVAGPETVVSVGGSTVHVGTCAAGATTYHVHRVDDVLVSIISVGPGRLGEGVVTGLRP